MEQIRRLNRLWASDSLFLREHLLIPVPADATHHLVLDVNSFNKSADVGEDNHAAAAERSIDDFLDQIDSSIATTKSQVSKVQGSSQFVSEEGDLFVRRKAARSRLRQQQQQQAPTPAQVSSSSGSQDLLLLSAPHPVVMTQGRKVRSSLQRLEREQDEIFEL